MEEKWQAIKGFENYYEVSSNGNVRALERIVKCRNNSKAVRKRGAVKLHFDVKGYTRAMLSKEHKYKNCQVHRLVANAFIENAYNKPYVNHKNGIKHDNRLENLEWCTASENKIHYLTIICRGENSASAHKSIKCINTGKIYFSQVEAAKELKIHSSHISSICKGKRKTTKGYSFAFI